VNQGVILYGPPAAGKDTVTAALEALDSRFNLFPRIKVGAGRTNGYRIATAEQLEELRAANAIVWENEQYGAVYAVDRPELHRRLQLHIPVLHLGQVEAVDAIVNDDDNTQWTVVYLWCPRNVAEQRIAARMTGDTQRRLDVWDRTPLLQPADVVISTADLDPASAAAAIGRYALRQASLQDRPPRHIV
jgi:guanylate kinase